MDSWWRLAGNQTWLANLQLFGFSGLCQLVQVPKSAEKKFVETLMNFSLREMNQIEREMCSYLEWS
jgi:hypothetical protein